MVSQIRPKPSSIGCNVDSHWLKEVGRGTTNYTDKHFITVDVLSYQPLQLPFTKVVRQKKAVNI